MFSYSNRTSLEGQKKITAGLRLNGFFSLTVACALLLMMATVAAAAGNLDRSFGTNGKAITPIGNGADRGYDVALQPDGKIVVAGVTFGTSFHHTAVARYKTDGTLDENFGTNGKVVLSISTTNDVANAVGLQSDGKILVTGYTTVNGQSDFFITRLNNDGTLDTNFGTGGTAVVPISATASDVAMAVATQNIGGEERIVAAGYGGNTNSDFVVVRLNANGTLDNTFDTDGIVTTPISSTIDVAYDMAIDPLNPSKIIVVGYTRFDAGGGSFNEDFAVVRYNSDGTLDATFDTDGKVTTNMSAIDKARALSFQLIGGQLKIVVGGISMRNSRHDFAIVRYNDNGSVDTNFGANGRVITAIGNDEDQIHDLIVNGDNTIIAAGFARMGVNGVNEDFAVVRYHHNGALDTSFGSCGKIVTSLASGNGTDLIYGVAVQPDGKVIAAGHTVSGTSTNLNDDIAVLRYTSVGRSASPTSVDFDADGKEDVAVFRPSSGMWYQNCSCATPKYVQFGQADDKLIPADYDGDGKADVAVFRGGAWYITYSSNGNYYAQQFGMANDVPVAGDFDGDGRADLAVFRPSNGYWYVSKTSNGEFQAVQLGAEGDKPVPADYDNDGRTDFAVFRPSTGTWYTSPDPANNYGAVQFGANGDVPVQGDYDGDGRADLAVFRPAEGRWYVQQTSGGFRSVQFGVAADVPVAGDFDGDGKHDLAVFRNGTWYIQNSTGGVRTIQWGAAGDVPVAAR